MNDLLAFSLFFQLASLFAASPHHLADIWTKGNFTRDEWNHLLCLFNISNFSLHRNWTESMENPWNSGGRFFRGFTTLQILLEIPKLMKNLECEPEQFQGRRILMSMYNDIEWRDPQNERVCLANSTVVSAYAIEVLFRSLVIPRTRVRNEMERDRHLQAWRRMGQSR